MNIVSLATRGVVKATFLAIQHAPAPLEPRALFNLHESCGNHPSGSTVTLETIRKLGMDAPIREVLKASLALERAQGHSWHQNAATG